MHDLAGRLAHRVQLTTDGHNPEFWRIWMTRDKPGSLMPAFASSQGGPLNDLQIVSLTHHPTAVANKPVK